MAGNIFFFREETQRLLTPALIVHLSACFISARARPLFVPVEQTLAGVTHDVIRVSNRENRGGVEKLKEREGER